MFLMVALVASACFAQSDDWEQVPSQTDHETPVGSPGAGASTTGSKAAMACALVGAMVRQIAIFRDKGISEESQLASIDNPSGKLYQLTIGNMLAADTAGSLRSGIRNEIAYVYQHREMTAAQLGEHARVTCGNSESHSDGHAPSAARSPSG